MDSAVAVIAEWMPLQRWFGGKGHAHLLRLIGGFELPTGAEDTRVRTLLVMDDASEPPILYQVPVVDRAERAHSPAASDHLIGRLPDGGLLYDGPHDRAYTDALLALIVGEQQAESKGADASGHYSEAERGNADRANADLGSARPPASAPATGHLAFAQEFLPGVEDAWHVALLAADAATTDAAGRAAFDRTEPSAPSMA